MMMAGMFVIAVSDLATSQCHTVALAGVSGPPPPATRSITRHIHVHVASRHNINVNIENTETFIRSDFSRRRQRDACTTRSSHSTNVPQGCLFNAYNVFAQTSRRDPRRARAFFFFFFRGLGHNGFKQDESEGRRAVGR